MSHEGAGQPITRRRFVGRVAVTGVSLSAAGVFLQACGAKAGGGAAKAGAKLRVFQVPKFEGFVFWELARKGGEEATKELGTDFTYIGPDSANVEQQVQVLQNVLPQSPDVIVLGALDVNALVPALEQAKQRNTVVVTFDSDVAPKARSLFVDSMTFEQQAKAIADSALANAPEGGEAVWMGVTPTTGNVVAQKKALDALIKSDPKYGSLKFVDVLYAQDDPEKSYAAAINAMHANPNLRLFMTGSGLSLPAINRAIRASGKATKVYGTGFGLPDTMKTYLKDGTCKQFALWSPSDQGYLATYAAILIKQGKLKPAEGTTFKAGRLGDRQIGADGRVLLGEPLFFTRESPDFPAA
jgi:rhamnose transport system substrate-binding protein